MSDLHAEGEGKNVKALKPSENERVASFTKTPSSNNNSLNTEENLNSPKDNVEFNQRPRRLQKCAGDENEKVVNAEVTVVRNQQYEPQPGPSWDFPEEAASLAPFARSEGSSDLPGKDTLHEKFEAMVVTPGTSDAKFVDAKSGSDAESDIKSEQVNALGEPEKVSEWNQAQLDEAFRRSIESYMQEMMKRTGSEESDEEYE